MCREEAGHLCVAVQLGSWERCWPLQLQCHLRRQNGPGGRQLRSPVHSAVSSIAEPPFLPRIVPSGTLLQGQGQSPRLDRQGCQALVFRSRKGCALMPSRQKSRSSLGFNGTELLRAEASPRRSNTEQSCSRVTCTGSQLHLVMPLHSFMSHTPETRLHASNTKNFFCV